MNTRKDNLKHFGALLATCAMFSPLKGQEPTFPPPPVPVPLPPDFTLSLAPADAEVDSFIRVVEARGRFNVSGKGLTVAVIDTGVNQYHRDFQGKILATRNFSNDNPSDPNDATDRQGHGSNVASIVAGARSGGPDGGLNTGIAHDANLVALKVFPGGAFGRVNAALEWVLANHKKFNISVVNMSLGDQTNASSYSENLDPVYKRQAELIAQLSDKNIAVVVAAGNYYSSFKSQEGMAFPGIVPSCISVGAIYDSQIIRSKNKPLRVYADGAVVYSSYKGRCAAFSQRLSEEKGLGARTDVFAPGFFVTAAGKTEFAPDGAPSHELSRTSQSTQDGTSQATPVTAGIILLIQERYRKITADLGGDSQALPPVDLIIRCLREGGVVFTDHEDDIASQMDNVISCEQSFLRVDAVGALEALDAAFRTDSATLAIDLFNAKDIKAQKSLIFEAKILNKSIVAPAALKVAE